MYTSFFGLNEKPFSITPDPRYLFMSKRHGEALAHLVYGVTESGGFMQLTGEVGTGKTTLVRTLLQNRLPENADVAVILNPQLSALEFLQTICEELGVSTPDEKDSSKALIDALRSGRIWGAGLDVFAGEPRVDSGYFDLPNVFMLPHTGSSTIEARMRMGQILIDALTSWQEGERPDNQVC